MRLADRRTYRQLVCLALFESEDFELALMRLDTARSEGDSHVSDAITAEVRDLGRDVLGVKQAGGSVIQLSATYDSGDLSRSKFARLGATRAGQDLEQLMRLDRIPKPEFLEVFAELGGLPEMLTSPSAEMGL